MAGAVRSVVASCWVGAVHETVYQWLQTPKRQRITAETLAGEVSRCNLRGIGAERDVSRRLCCYESRGKLQIQLLCGADDNPWGRMNTGG